MSDKTKRPIHLVIDGNKQASQIVKGDLVNVVEVPAGMIRNFSITLALNGGYALVLSYSDSEKQDVLVFQTSAELLEAMSKLVQN